MKLNLKKAKSTLMPEGEYVMVITKIQEGVQGSSGLNTIITTVPDPDKYPELDGARIRTYVGEADDAQWKVLELAEALGMVPEDLGEDEDLDLDIDSMVEQAVGCTVSVVDLPTRQANNVVRYYPVDEIISAEADAVPEED